MRKKILITSTDLMMIQFLAPHVIHLAENGYRVEIACSNVGGRIEEVKEKLKDSIENLYVVELKRSPLSFKNFKGCRQLKKIIADGEYDLIWTNEPVMGVMTRLAAQKARKKGTKVLYMAHGFHFFKGAPKLNWLVYYPIEKIMASKADMIATVNHEDYQRAKTFKCRQVEYVHGIGIDTQRLTATEEQKDVRAELGLEKDDFIVLSVGELNKNKNQKVIIQALDKLNDKKIHYLLCGRGDQLKNLQALTEKLNSTENVHFLGYRKDVVDICSQADLYVMPSYREGLPVSSLEAMYCGLPLVTSNIRGLVDVMEDGVSGYTHCPDDVEGFANSIKALKENEALRKQMGANNRETVKQYCLEEAKKEVLAIIAGL